MIKRENYFYIDESGNLGNDSPVFIHGCIKTDSPHILSDAIQALKREISGHLYFECELEKFLKQGLHATENHPDIRAEFYKILFYLQYRGYFVVIDKSSDYFKRLVSEKSEHEIFSLTLRRLLSDRIVGTVDDHNIFLFERIDLKGKPLIHVLRDLFASMDIHRTCEYSIASKEEENMAVIDYLNYTLFKILESQTHSPRYRANFDLVAPKIGVINILHNGTFLNRRGRSIEYESLIKGFGGTLG